MYMSVDVALWRSSQDLVQTNQLVVLQLMAILLLAVIPICCAQTSHSLRTHKV